MVSLNPLYARVGRMIPGARANALNAAKSAMKKTPLGPGAPRKAAGQAAMRSVYAQAGRRPTRVGLGMGVLGASTAMRPNADQSRTSYRGPMQTGRGVGRYA